MSVHSQQSVPTCKLLSSPKNCHVCLAQLFFNLHLPTNIFSSSPFHISPIINKRPIGCGLLITIKHIIVIILKFYLFHDTSAPYYSHTGYYCMYWPLHDPYSNQQGSFSRSPPHSTGSSRCIRLCIPLHSLCTQFFLYQFSIKIRCSTHRQHVTQKIGVGFLSVQARVQVPGEKNTLTKYYYIYCNNLLSLYKDSNLDETSLLVVIKKQIINNNKDEPPL